MSRIALEEVARIVSLARLEMDDRELERMQHDLEAILEHVEALSAVDTEGIEPTSHVIPLATPQRDDVPEPPMDPELAVANAPEASATAFVVPRVIAGEEEG